MELLDEEMDITEKEIILEQKRNELAKRKAELAKLRNQTEELKKKTEVGRNEQVESSILQTSTKTVSQPLALTAEQLEIIELKAKLQALTTKQDDPPVKSKDWNGELELNHSGIANFAKSIHKMYKDYDLPGEFNFSTPGKSSAKLSETKVLWLNLCTIIKILLSRAEDNDENLTEEEYRILGVTLNMCQILAEKRDAAVVGARFDEGTTDLFRSNVSSESLMLNKCKYALDQVISMREAQVRIGVNAPRQRTENFK